MVAIFDKIPRDIKARMLFSGKVEDAAAWSAVLRQVLESRLSPWQFAIISGELSTSMVQKRDDAEEVAKEGEAQRVLRSAVSAAGSMGITCRLQIYINIYIYTYIHI